MKSRSRARAAVFAVCALLALAPAANAATSANLRVEAGGSALDPGTNYRTGTVHVATNTTKCGGDGPGDSRTLQGPTALGLFKDAGKTNSRLTPFLVSDQYSFGLIVCQAGSYGAFDANQAWLYKVNHRFAEVGGDQYRLGGGENVLWYFADWSTGANTGKELALDAPGQAKAEDPFSVRATAYDDQGQPSPAGGITITGGDDTALTGPDGQTTVTASREGTITLRGTHRPDIPTAPVEVQVSGARGDTPAPSSSPSGGDSGGETGSPSEGGAGSGPGSSTGFSPGAPRAGSSGSRSGGGSRSGDSSSGALGNSARSAAAGAARADAGGGSGGRSVTGRSNEGPGDDVDGSGVGRSTETPGGNVEDTWDGKPIGELLSASDVNVPPTPVLDGAEGRTGLGGGVWLVLLLVALGVVVLTAAGGFLLRRPRMRTLLSGFVTSGPFSRITSNLRSSRPSSE